MSRFQKIMIYYLFEFYKLHPQIFDLRLRFNYLHQKNINKDSVLYCTETNVHFHCGKPVPQLSCFDSAVTARSAVT